MAIKLPVNSTSCPYICLYNILQPLVQFNSFLPKGSDFFPVKFQVLLPLGMEIFFLFPLLVINC